MDLLELIKHAKGECQTWYVANGNIFSVIWKELMAMI